MISIQNAGAAVRCATSEDAHRLAALSIQVWLSTYATTGVGDTAARFVLSKFSAQNFIQLINEEEVVVLIAETGVNLTGYALVRFACPCPVAPAPNTELCTLYVQEPFTGCGVGSALLSAAQSVAAQRTESGGLWLSVKADNARAQTFYNRRGFIMRGTTEFVLGSQSFENHVLIFGRTP